MSKLEKQRATAKWVLFALLVYCLLITLLITVLPKCMLLAFFSPFTVLGVYLEVWKDEYPAIVIVSRTLIWLLAVLPLVGWVLLYQPIRAGKPLIIAPFCFLLASNIWITMCHIIVALGTRNSAHMEGTRQYLGQTALLFAVSLVISVAVLVSVNIWRPKKT